MNPINPNPIKPNPVKLNISSKTPTVKPEITHTLGGQQILWVITGYGFSQVFSLSLLGLGANRA